MACKVLINVPVAIKSLSGILHYFKFKESYCIIGTIVKDVECEPCSVNTKGVKHFIIDIDGEIYHVPEDNALMTDLHYYENERDHYADHVARHTDQTKDYHKAIEEAFGIKVKGDFADGVFVDVPQIATEEDNEESKKN